MKRRAALWLSLGFGAAPFAFGVVRRLNSHHDLLVLWMALASGVMAILIYALAKANPVASMNRTAYAFLTLVLCTVAGAMAAFRAGASGAGGVWAVAAVIGICWALSFWFRSYVRASVG